MNRALVLLLEENMIVDKNTLVAKQECSMEGLCNAAVLQ